MPDSDEQQRIAKERQRWEETTLKRNLDRLGLDESPRSLHTPAEGPDGDYMDRLGFPGEYPFTRGAWAVPAFGSPVFDGSEGAAGPRAGVYAGYGTAEDTRDLWRAEGRRGANVAFDLPTQCGYDSDHPMAAGEVGRVGIAVDTLDDFETLYQAFDGVVGLDEMASNYTINAPCNVILAMYFALAEKKGVPLDRLRGTPQNDILKEFVARGTYIFPVEHSMRMIRDTITFCTEHAPRMNVISVCGYHIREAGATDVQAPGFAFSHAIAYIQLGLEAGLDIDDFVSSFTFNDIGGGMDFWREIARARADRRIWAKIVRERFGSKNPSSWIMRGGDQVLVGPSSYTLQRPMNNLVRGVLGGVASFLATGNGRGGIPWDEVFGLGHSYEAQQAATDAARIMRYEAQLGRELDPLAGSYFMESLTDEVEAEIMDVVHRIDDLGGAVEAVRSGYTQREVTTSAYQMQRQIEEQRRIVVGVNAFQRDDEIDFAPHDLHHPYDTSKLNSAGERQIERLHAVKAQRSQTAVDASLKALHTAAADDRENLIPHLMDAVKAYATVGEICDLLRDVFGLAAPGAEI